jgi:hypothetical protein
VIRTHSRHIISVLSKTKAQEPPKGCNNPLEAFIWASSGTLFSWLNPEIFCSVLNGLYGRQDTGRKFQVTARIAELRGVINISR